MAIGVAGLGVIFFGLLDAAAGRALAFIDAAQWTALVAVACSAAPSRWPAGCRSTPVSGADASWLPTDTWLSAPKPGSTWTTPLLRVFRLRLDPGNVNLVAQHEVTPVFTQRNGVT